MSNNIVVIFGKRVRERRRELNYTQEKLSNLASLSRSYIGGVETGKRNISLKNAEKISKALKVHIALLLK